MGLFYFNEKEAPEDLQPNTSSSVGLLIRTESRPAESITPATKVEALSQTSILGEAITQTLEPKTKTVKAQFDCEDIDIDDGRYHRAREGGSSRPRARDVLARSPPPHRHRTHTSRPKGSHGPKGMEPALNPKIQTAELNPEDIHIDDGRHQRAREGGRKRRQSTHRRRKTRANRSLRSPVPRKRARNGAAYARRPRKRPAGSRKIIKKPEEDTVNQLNSDLGSDVGSVSSVSSSSRSGSDDDV